MKTLVLVSVLAAFAATPAMAFVQSGHLQRSQPGRGTTTNGSIQHYDEPGSQGGGSTIIPPSPSNPANGPGAGPGLQGEDPTAPVPEPGTMALASMGLIALGAAARRRRNNR